MTVGPARALGSIDPRAIYADRPQAPGGGDFGAQLQQALQAVDARLTQRDDLVQQMVRGEPLEVHEIMTTAQEAQLAFELMLEVRNKLLEAYQEIMRMQV